MIAVTHSELFYERVLSSIIEFCDFQGSNQINSPKSEYPELCDCGNSTTLIFNGHTSTQACTEEWLKKRFDVFLFVAAGILGVQTACLLSALMMRR